MVIGSLPSVVTGRSLREDPGAEEHEAQEGGDDVRRDEHGELDAAWPRRGRGVQEARLPLRQREAEREDDEALRLVPQAVARRRARRR